MKTFIIFFLILAAIMVVGKIEDPCTTEGLAPGCIEKINQDINDEKK